MMGRSHAASGWCTGLAVAPLVGLHQLPQVLLFAVVTAGWALAPDLDHPGAVATRWGGWATEGLSVGLQWLSAVVFAATRTQRDRDSEGTHRHLSHTALFAVLVGVVTALATVVSPWWMVLVPVAIGALLAARVLGNWVLYVGCIPLVWGILVGGVTLGAVQGWIGVAVALGCVTHSAGDALTLAGCPLLAPLPIRGQRWFRVGPPRVMRFRTGGDVEQLVVFPVFVVLGVLLVPGVLSVAVGLVDALV
jgi:membrane-bound metal-dependent hydrolase YbcI (DUF457 family)